LYDKLNVDWAPTLKLGHGKVLPSPSAATDRYNRVLGRVKKGKRHDAAETLASLQDVLVDDQIYLTEEYVDHNTREIQTDLIGHNLEQIQQELRRLTIENMELKSEIASRKMTAESLEGDDDKVNYLTGLSTHLILMQVFSLISSYLTETHLSSLTKFQQLMLTLMKLRLNVQNEFLGIIFQCAQPTVSRTFLNTLHVLTRLQPLIRWPEREEIKKTMPMEFRRYLNGKVVVIIDCFEVFIETPSNAEAKAMTWSSYKHHNTVKFLIGITPQGTISFLSQAWCGRASDKFVTENSGFLKKLLPGDVVMADRGFDVKDSIGVMMASVKMPAFTKGKKQMPALELEESRKLAHLRIHVERVIGLMRQKYTFLSGIVPIDHLRTTDDKGLTTIDKVAIVCAALTNLSPNIVSFD
jgi:hypothetical protein